MRRILFVLLVMLAAAARAQPFSDGEVTYTVEEYLVANYPVALAFAPDGRLFYTEKTTGSVRVVSPDGMRQLEPVITLPTSALAERGMLGIAVDPNFENNGFLWVSHIAPATDTEPAVHRIVRFREDDGVGSDPQVMFEISLENNALIHLGGNLHFDLAERLYFSVGDNEAPANSQDRTTPQGAIHRFAVAEDALLPAEGNPFDDSTIYAYGFRNPFDFTLDPVSERLFATENGDNCDDEINLVLPGFNYGAGPEYTCGGTAANIDLAWYQPPMLSYTPTEAPTGITVYDHEAAAAWQGDLFFCTWKSGTLRRAELNESRNRIEAVHELELGDAQCRIDLAVGPEGALYFSSVGEGGGAIYRLLPESVQEENI